MESELVEYGFIAGVIVMACLHGFLLAGIFLFTRKLRSRATKFLAFALMGVTIFLAYEASAWFHGDYVIPI